MTGGKLTSLFSLQCDVIFVINEEIKFLGSSEVSILKNKQKYPNFSNMDLTNM